MKEGILRTPEKGADMKQKIGFLGKGGIGKSTVVSHLSVALARKGLKVLFIGNDISLSSTVLLRGDMDIEPVLDAYREKYIIELSDYIIKSPSGVYCMELGGINPGTGCMARGINVVDEMLHSQKVIEKLELDYIFYDITVETPCTGMMLAVRNGIIDRCIVLTECSFSSLTVANSILAAIQNAKEGETLNVQLFVNFADNCELYGQVIDYSKMVGVPIFSCLKTFEEIDKAYLLDQTIFESNPASELEATFGMLADKINQPTEKVMLQVPTPRQLLKWNREY